MRGRARTSNSLTVILQALLLHAAGLAAFADEVRTPAAMAELARRYEHGINCPRDIGRALFWYRQAAQAGEAGAMLALGDLYSEGRCVQRDLPYALGMYRNAAELGFAPAMLRLGEHIEHRNRDEALHWYRKAADRGYGPAMTRLGDATGEAEWYRKAVAAGEPPAFARLAAALDGEEALDLLRRGAELGDPAAQSLYGQRIEKSDPAAAATLFRAAAEGGDAAAMERWAYYSENGLGGVRQSAGEARLWYRKAAEAGHPAALHWVAVREKDADVARMLLKKAADAGHPPAMTRLARMNGDAALLEAAAEAGDPDALLQLGLVERAAAAGSAEALARLGRFREAAALGHAPSLLKLGRVEEAAAAGDAEALYKRGLAMPDRSEGTRSIQLAAAAGHVAAMRELGLRYRHGSGAPADERLATEWLARAATAGDAEALFLTGAFREAAAKGYAPAMVKLGEMTGDRTWFERAAASGYANAWTKLGELERAAAAGDPEARTLLGDRARKANEAYRLYVEAANAGYAPAMVRAGDCHLHGRGASRSEIDAVNWYRRAALAGSEEAMDRLRKMGKGL